MSNIGGAIIVLLVIGAAVVGVFYIDLDKARDNAIGDRGAAVEEAVESETDAETETEAETEAGQQNEG